MRNAELGYEAQSCGREDVCNGKCTDPLPDITGAAEKTTGRVGG